MKTQDTQTTQPAKKLTLTKSTIRIVAPAPSSQVPEPTQDCTYTC
jgi:hypothetical protein